MMWRRTWAMLAAWILLGASVHGAVASPDVQQRKESPPDVGATMLEEPLTAPGSAQPLDGPGWGSTQYTPEGLRLRLESPQTRQAGAVVEGIQFVEGEVSFEFHISGEGPPARLGVILRRLGERGEKFVISLDPAQRSAMLQRVTVAGAMPLDQAQNQDIVAADTWNRVSIRQLRGAIWVMLDGRPVLFAQDDDPESVWPMILFQRSVTATDAGASQALVRNLRISALADSPAEDRPFRYSISAISSPPHRSDPPRIDVSRVERLAPSAVFELVPCPSGLAEARTEGNRLTLIAHGACDAQMLGEFQADGTLRGLLMRDGELILELDGLAHLDYARINLLIGSTAGDDGVQFSIAPGIGAGFIGIVGPAGFALHSVANPGSFEPLTGPVRVAVRMQAASAWLLVNGKVVLDASGLQPRGSHIAIGVADGNRRSGHPPVTITINSIEWAPLLEP